MKNKQYIKAIFFLMSASIISVLNDVILKMLTKSNSLIDIMFLRFFFAAIILTPLLLIYKIKIKKSDIKTHATRAILFGAGMCLFTKSITTLPIALVTFINFTTPILVVLLACIFLKESWKGKLIPVLVAIFGIFIACYPYFKTTQSTSVLILLLATLLFAILDVFNKHLLNKSESMIMMLFGSSLGIAIIYLPFFSFNIPAILDIFYLILLGIGSNSILYFLLKAWSMDDISSLQPIKYIEFPISVFFGNLIFMEQVNIHIILGLVIIIFANLMPKTK